MTMRAAPILDTSLGVCYRAITMRLSGYDALWGDRVFTRKVPPRVAMPYVRSYRVGGGLLRGNNRQIAEYVIATEVFAPTFALANQGAVLINNALRDSGDQDVRRWFGEIDGWLIVAVTEGEPREDEETRSDGVLVYRNGNEYIWRLERV